MFQRGRKSLRGSYEDQFMRDSGNGREVTFRRVVNIVERRSPAPLPGGDLDRRAQDGQWHNESRPYQDPRERQGNINYPQNNMHLNPGFGHASRNSSPPRNEGQFSQHLHNRDDLRYHLDSRNNGRGGNYFRNRGRESGPHMREDVDYRRRESFTSTRNRSTPRRSSSGSKPADKNYSHQQKRPADPFPVPQEQTQKQQAKATAQVSPPPSSPVEEPPQSAASSKENPPASAAKLEEVVAASVEPEPTPEKDLKARRLEAIRAKALEIMKDYRQDCETFRTVVKMLVAKEPSLDYLLQAPLDKNLEEIKDRCLDSLRQFIKELDEVIVQPSTTEQATGSAT